MLGLFESVDFIYEYQNFRQPKRTPVTWALVLFFSSSSLKLLGGTTCALLLGFSWGSHGVLLGFSWGSHEVLMRFSWYKYFVDQCFHVKLRLINLFLLGFSWGSLGVLVGFSWGSLGVLLGFSQVNTVLRSRAFLLVRRMDPHNRILHKILVQNALIDSPSTSSDHSLSTETVLYI